MTLDTKAFVAQANKLPGLDTVQEVPINTIHLLEVVAIANEFIDSDSKTLRLKPAAEFDKYSRTAIRVFCHRFARYGLPTTELIDFLKDAVGTSRAIEIGAGHGDTGHHLGIPRTDSWMQASDCVRHYYEMMGQPIIDYPASVEKLEALKAVEKYRPEVVIGSWITQKISPHLPPPDGGGSVFGVNEREMLTRVKKYIMVGNLAIHGKKKIMDLNPEVIELPGLRSRSSHPELDRIFIWNGTK